MSAPASPAVPAAGERRIAVGELTRVEGEGSLTLVVRDGKVVEARLGIFEAPRYFEQLVLGKTPDEVIDIVARICGICPVAYQMSAVHASRRPSRASSISSRHAARWPMPTSAGCSPGSPPGRSRSAAR